MKQLLASLLFALGLTAHADTITVVSPYNAAHSGTPALLKIFDVANKQQSQYTFVLDFKAGANGLLALQAVDQTPQDRMALIHAGFADMLDTNTIKNEDWIPVWSLGSACWAVVSNTGAVDIAGLKAQKEIVAGGVGFGTAAHITAIEIGEKVNVPTRFVTYKSAADVVTAIAANQGPVLGMSPIRLVNSLKDKNPKLQAIAMSCPQRNPMAQNVKTLKEQGIDSVYIFNTVVAHASMNAQRRQDIAKILESAAAQIGLREILELSDMHPPQFERINVEKFHSESIAKQRDANQRYKKRIEEHRQGL